MKRRTIQPLLRFDLALLCACLVTSPPSAKAISVTWWDHDWTLSVGSNIYGLQGMATGTPDAWTIFRFGNQIPDLILSVDVRIVAAAVIATLLLATFCILGLLSFSLRSKPKLTEHVKAP
ncbi:MAG: hypothetical protein EB141_19095 [Verrucomicrobia bacterium]|nr:hypothetical protein [Pseudomonadota bacterium]NDA67013.1 hypothetical protein [Verrucomicrobiota bacterium]NDB77720.1 hypothetical protein [Verrucomicrobiota bacterium]NDD38891.1 hypothetical protein [Verrucomicrobiota bacterium]NDE98815.1 hypothetical protein [Verrucomicrobiota bacterium]